MSRPLAKHLSNQMSVTLSDEKPTSVGDGAIYADAPSGMVFSSTGTAVIVASYSRGEKQDAWSSLVEDFMEGLEIATEEYYIANSIPYKIQNGVVMPQ